MPAAYAAGRERCRRREEVAAMAGRSLMSCLALDSHATAIFSKDDMTQQASATRTLPLRRRSECR